MSGTSIRATLLEIDMKNGLYERIYETVKSVPAGMVATYG